MPDVADVLMAFEEARRFVTFAVTFAGNDRRRDAVSGQRDQQEGGNSGHDCQDRFIEGSSRREARVV